MSLSHRSIAIVAAVVAALLLLVGCGGSDSARGNSDPTNSYMNALNSLQVSVESLVDSGTPQDFQSALTESLPAIRKDIERLQAAQGNLSGDAQSIAQRCTADVESVIAGFDAINAAVKASDDAASSRAAFATNTKIGEFDACVNEWNSAHGASQNS